VSWLLRTDLPPAVAHLLRVSEAGRGACAKYAFSLGKSYSSESLKSSDRIHAIRFGEFYLRAFGDKTKWGELKEVFQHWNIDRNSSFASLDVSQFDPKIVESMMDLIKVVGGKRDDKAK